MNEKFTVRQCVAGAAAYILLAAAIPRLNHILLWPARLGPRRLLVYVAGDTLLRFSISHYLVPYAKRIAEERDRLKDKLGRDPTDDELTDHFGYGSSD